MSTKGSKKISNQGNEYFLSSGQSLDGTCSVCPKATQGIKTM